jgi:hypothetical protein
MAQPKLLELARKGDLDAISLLINRSLQTQGITAKLMRHGDCLKILLEGKQVPPQSLAKSLQTGLETLEIPEIDRLDIYGKQSDASTVTWSKTVQFTQLAAPSTAAAPLSQVPSIQSSSAKAIPETTRVKSCPRSYFVLALLTTFLAFLPLGIAALFFSKQVKPQYNKQNYEGAKSASETAKILCIVGICLASPFYLAIGFLATGYSIFTTAYERQLDSLYESQAKIAIEAINRGQQAYWLENSRFAASTEQLQLPLQPNHRYQYQLVPIESDRAIVTATATKPGLKSFTGIVHAATTEPVFASSEFVKKALLQSTICITNHPVEPEQILIEDDRIICPSKE